MRGARVRAGTLALLVLGGGFAFAGSARADDAFAELPAVQSGALRVFLVRHGQALSNLDPTPDLPAAQLDHLTALGTQQAEAVGRALAGRGVSAVLSSPASRARETAEALARLLGIQAPRVEPRLRPLELGVAPDGRSLAWKDRTPEWLAGRDPRPPEGESLEDVGERVSHLVRALARSRRGASLVLVAHGEVIGSYLGRVRGTPAPKRYPLSLANGSISVVDVGATGSESLRLANQVPKAP
jgi:2,3-bisphosphoglycerate-dependent phosphoglycerate mutase